MKYPIGIRVYNRHTNKHEDVLKDALRVANLLTIPVSTNFTVCEIPPYVISITAYPGDTIESLEDKYKTEWNKEMGRKKRDDEATKYYIQKTKEKVK